jgi:hypothetical protein
MRRGIRQEGEDIALVEGRALFQVGSLHRALSDHINSCNRKGAARKQRCEYDGNMV